MSEVKSDYKHPENQNSNTNTALLAEKELQVKTTRKNKLLQILSTRRAEKKETETAMKNTAGILYSLLKTSRKLPENIFESKELKQEIARYNKKVKEVETLEVMNTRIDNSLNQINDDIIEFSREEGNEKIVASFMERADLLILDSSENSAKITLLENELNTLGESIQAKTAHQKAQNAAAKEDNALTVVLLLKKSIVTYIDLLEVYKKQLDEIESIKKELKQLNTALGHPVAEIENSSERTSKFFTDAEIASKTVENLKFLDTIHGGIIISDELIDKIIQANILIHGKPVIEDTITTTQKVKENTTASMQNTTAETQKQEKSTKKGKSWLPKPGILNKEKKGFAFDLSMLSKVPVSKKA